ncbi:MAG: hypothetical protein JWM68_2375, partial [Verrucomicrobiales bacterium]|nr:hypothetical protein [Verrucomicrobiales bacterium]
MKKAVVLLFATVAVCFNSSANLQVTAASGGTGISADKAANAPSPQWTTLGNIVLKEGGGPNQVDFGPNGSVVLNAPSGFEFSTNGTVAFDAGKNITAATVTAAPSSITLSVTANNASPAKDTLTISGLQVRPTVGTPLAAAGNITKGTSSGMVFGNNVTFGALSEVAGIGAALTITTQPSTNAVTVTPFAQQPVVRVVDQFGNNSNTNSTDVVSASVNSGTGTLVGTTNIALVNGVATYTDLGANSSGIITILFSSGSLTSVVSGPVDVTGPPAPSALVIQTQPSSTATAGVAFAQQPAIAIYDQFGAALTNDNSTQVTAARLDGAGTLQGTLTATAVNGVATFTDLSHTLATNITIVFTSGFLSSATSSNITVVAANADHLAFSVEPGNAIAGLAFGTQPTVITLDQFNNPSSAGLATNLSLNIALTTGTGPLSGTTNIDIGPTGANGVAAFSNLSSAAVDGTNQLTASAAGFSDVTSAFFAVNPQVAAQLAITTQPSTNATAGAVFAQQPVVEVRDALGNLITSDNTTVVHAARGTGTGALVGTVDVTAVNGVATFTDISFNSVQTISLVFSSAGLTNATSGDVVVSAAPADRLVFTTQPAGGYAGSAFLTQPVLVTRDQFGNNSSVGLASNQVVTVVLTSGTGALIGTTNIDISTGTASFTDLGVNAAGPGKVITASSAGLTNALSGTFTIGGVDPASANISADTAVSGYTTISGPTYYEGASGDVGVGTIVLNAPAGYEFDATGTAPTVRIQKTSGPGNNDNIQGTGSPSGGPNNAVWPVTSVSTTQITFTVTTNSIGKTDSLTWQNIRIRALVGNPLGNGIVTNSGTATLTATDGTTSFANLQTVAGAAAQLVIQTQPSTNPPVGVVFAQQPVILVQDQFGNPRTTDNATVVTASRNLGMGDLQGTTNITAINGVVTFTNISYNVAEAITINFTSGALTPVTSALIQMGAGIVTHLVFVVEPGFAVVGFPFGSQPVVKTADAYGNFSTGGLPASQLVDIGLNLGSGLSGTTSKDIGTAAGNGTVSFTDLKISVVGETNQLVAVAQEAPISNAFSVIFPVSAVPDHLVLVQGDGQTGTVGSTLAINPIVQVVDTNGAPISGATVSFNVQSGGGSVGSSTSVTGTNGYASTTWTLGGITGTNTLVASAFGIGVPTNITFTATSVSDVAAQLVITTEPSSSAVAGVQFAQQPVVQIQDQYGNLVSGDNTTVVTAGSGVGATTGLLGTTGVTAVNGVVTYTNLSYNTAQTINLAFSSAGLTNATSTDVVVSPAVASQLAFTTQPSGSRTDSILNPQPVVVTQDQFGNASTNGLPASLSLTLTVTNGTGSLVGTTAVDVGSAAANGVATFTNVQVTAAGLGKQLLASAAGLTNAISTVFNVGGVDPAIIPVIPANGSSVSAVGPTYYEFASGDVGVGTIILNAPVGYQFDTSSIPTVTVKRIGGTGAPSKNINGASNGGGGTTSAVTSFTATQITFTINSASTGGVTDSITWNNIKVQAATGIPAALSDITKSGSSVLAAVVDNVTSFGALTSDPRPAQLAIQTEPSSSANAGVVFAQQPVVLVKDQFGNLWTNTSVNVTATRGTGTAALQGTTTVASVNGVATFANLSYNAVETITIDFSGNLLVGTTSSNVVVGPGIANHLVFSTQPGGAVYGNALNPQPVVKTQDQFGNDSTVGLGTNVTVTLSVSTGTGSLVGTSSLNIGTDGGNGTVSFSGLAIDAAGDK